MDTIIGLLSIIAAICFGAFLGYLSRQTIARKQAGTVEAKLAKLIEDSKNEAKEILFKAKERAVKILDEAKGEERNRTQQLQRMEEKLEKKEQNLDFKTQEFEKKQENLEKVIEQVKKAKQTIEESREKQIKELERVAKLSAEDAKIELLNLVEQEHKDLLFERIRKIENEHKEILEKKAKDIMTLAMQRYAASQVAEVTTTSVALPNEEIKGRIIGKEGRNIKTLERLTGVEILIDDVPDNIIISGFDPTRRQIAKIALEKLMSDGRIQPAKIEEAVEKAREEVGQKITEAGEAAVYDVGVAGLDPKLIKILGRLRFRTSYGQNVLLHSLEVAHLAGAIAAELGADVSVAKKAGLFHDIGKAVDHEIQGSHVEIGKMILQKFNMAPEIIKAMQSHHGDYPYESVESSIVQVADALSSARPGARKDTLDAYLKRLEELERIANSFPGIDKTYAIQAGREIRVFVEPEKIDDLSARKLARQIADKIQDDLKYPGEIKVNVIRETRVIEYAR